MANLNLKKTFLAALAFFLFIQIVAAHGDDHAAGAEAVTAAVNPSPVVNSNNAVSTLAQTVAGASPTTLNAAGSTSGHGDHDSTSDATTANSNGAATAGGHGGHGSGSVTMTPFFHFHTGDALFFEAWVPRSVGAMIGSCIGLFLLAIFERCVNALRGRLEVQWRQRAAVAYKSRVSSDKEQLNGAGERQFKVLTLRGAPPFIWSSDISRGLLHAGQALLGFMFMLAVMTYQVFFIAAVVLGLGLGEIIFGRFAGSGPVHAH